ncbi:MAG TPA: tRNA (5-methylaminomethyl-2-thiouridine)(34)-methyltransferase MnmD [Chitinophagaceae bacterium]
MQRQPVITKDGSHTLAVPEMNVTYHSLHGAIQESLHVYIQAGLYKVSDAPAKGGTSDTIRIFEMGFGTGLNALLTQIENEKLQLPVHYTAIELFPLDTREVHLLNYCRLLDKPGLQTAFEQIHQCDWEKDIAITPLFTIHKINCNLVNFSSGRLFNLVYFDAFAPAAQPGLWTKEVFENLYRMMYDDGILVTYCSKGDVRRAMQAAGFKTERISGPRGKREMLRAAKKA